MCVLSFLAVKACSCALQKKQQENGHVLCALRQWFLSSVTILQLSAAWKKQMGGGGTEVMFAGWVLYRWKSNGKFVVQRPVKRWIAAAKHSQTVLT